MSRLFRLPWDEGTGIAEEAHIGLIALASIAALIHFSTVCLVPPSANASKT